MSINAENLEEYKMIGVYNKNKSNDLKLAAAYIAFRATDTFVNLLPIPYLSSIEGYYLSQLLLFNFLACAVNANPEILVHYSIDPTLEDSVEIYECFGA